MKQENQASNEKLKALQEQLEDKKKEIQESEKKYAQAQSELKVIENDNGNIADEKLGLETQV